MNNNNQTNDLPSGHAPNLNAENLGLAAKGSGPTGLERFVELKDRAQAFLNGVNPKDCHRGRTQETIALLDCVMSMFDGSSTGL